MQVGLRSHDMGQTGTVWTVQFIEAQKFLDLFTVKSRYGHDRHSYCTVR